MSARELNLDGLIGPTHNYAGLSPGNLASQASAGQVSHPRAAALQGLAKMALLASLGIEQAVLPPPPRPALAWLRRLGFRGPDADVVERAGREAPELLAAAYSASSMWVANAATICPSADSADGRLHVTPANLVSELHRALEPDFTAELLRAVFAAPEAFVHHDPLPASLGLADEGAANHMRLARSYGAPGIQLFVYGREGPGGLGGPRRFPARQTRAASAAITRLHGVDRERVILARQKVAAIEAGVFHNDVIATGDRDLLLIHEEAFEAQAEILTRLRERFAATCGGGLEVVEVASRQLTLEGAVRSYLFNSQLVERPGGTRALVCPEECRESGAVRGLLDAWVAAGTLDEVHFAELRESMLNGGGPACLRLRVVLDDAELAAVHRGVRWSEALGRRLTSWVEAHYRETLRPDELRDPALIEEGRRALDELSAILGLGTVYSFQQN